MAFADSVNRLNAAVLGAFSTSVTLADESQVTGVLDRAPPAAGLGSEVGLATRLSQQVAAVLWLDPADAEGIAEQALLTADGTAYLVSRIDTEDGLIRLELVADTADEASPPAGERWR